MTEKQPSNFTKKVKANSSWGEGQWHLFQAVLKSHLLDVLRDDTRWHSMNVGDIFYTDGISRREMLRSSHFVCGIY